MTDTPVEHASPTVPRARIMGILNVTPDSFADGGQFDRLTAAVDHALAMSRAGADIIDIGGESTRPGHEKVSAETELARVIPVIRELKHKVDRPMSIDTSKALVAEKSLAAGVSILNDVWGLQHDPEIASVAAAFDVETIVMHNRTQIDPTIDIFEDMFRFFDKSLARAREAGLSDARIVLDPGIGFGKTLGQNLQLIKDIGRLKTYGFPVLIGLSRKSMIGKVLGNEVGERLIGSVVLDTLALAAGADIIRVHDVAQHVEARTLVEAVHRA
ncbi:dihydropteroate synthase [Amorphus orientalis]|uniref:Dihydropteroate synthase n=1 Tax=Amorphus orientalis TaxID=649198 RepID=A0AAE4ASR3_9HYPH|nr:dihydropteroate synthase [Amorphus orientalis]MDQ0316556.1 dihydropteroate synthase [Amorphus orientalis]